MTTTRDQREPVARDPGDGRPGVAPPPASRPDRVRVLAAWLAGAALLVTVLITVGPPLVGVGVLHGTDVLQTFAPWRADAPADFRPQNPYLTDTVNAALPMRAAAADAFADGELPWWTPLPGGGSNLMAVPDHAILHPLVLPYLVLPIWYAPAVAKVLEMLVAGLFTALFLRRLGAGWYAGLLAGTVYAANGFQVVWTNWPQAAVGASIPALFWSVERALQRRTAAALVPVALAVAVLLAGGFPAVAAAALLVAGAYALARTVRGSGRLRARLTRLAGVAAAVLAGTALMAVQLLPFLSAVADRGDLAYRAQGPEDHLPPAALATLVVPRALGLQADGRYFGPVNVLESVGFVGVAAVVLAVLALVAGRRVGLPPGAAGALWGSLAAALALTYLGGPLLAAAQEVLPALFGSNYVGRLRAVVAFLVAVLAGVGAQVLVEATTLRLHRRERVRALIAVGGLVVLGTVVAVDLLDWAARPGDRVYLRGAVVLPLVLLVSLVALGVAAARSPGARRALVVVVPVLVVVEAATLALPFLPRIDRDLFYPLTQAHRVVAAEAGPDRMLAEGRSFEPGSTSFYGLRTAAAHSYIEPRWREALVRVDPTAWSNRSFPRFDMPPRDPGRVPTSPVLDRLAVRVFAASPAAPVPGDRTEPPPATSTAAAPPGAAVTVPAPTGRLRAVLLRLEEAWQGSSGRADLLVAVRGPDGAVLAEGRRRVDDRLVEAGVLSVPLAEPDVPAGSVLELSLRATGGELLLAAGPGGLPVAGSVRAAEDGLRLVWADSAVVYRREGALPRLRWSGRSVVEPDPAARLDLLASGRLAADTVLLDAGRPGGTGADGRVELVTEESSRLVVDVEADGAGWLVVADGMQHGWQARLDGRPARLQPADHAVVAVEVPAGRHRVELRFGSPPLRVGQAVSAAALLGLLVLSGVSLRGRLRRSGSGSPDG